MELSVTSNPKFNLCSLSFSNGQSVNLCAMINFKHEFILCISISILSFVLHQGGETYLFLKKHQKK